MTEISNTDDVIDSRDIIARIEELGGMDSRTDDENAELIALTTVHNEAQDSPDWEYGEILIRDSYFVEYIRDLIHECYEMPAINESATGWPWRHMKMDYEAAAEEAKADYVEADFDGVTYWIRA